MSDAMRHAGEIAAEKLKLLKEVCMTNDFTAKRIEAIHNVLLSFPHAGDFDTIIKDIISSDPATQRIQELEALVRDLTRSYCTHPERDGRGRERAASGMDREERLARSKERQEYETT